MGKLVSRGMGRPVAERAIDSPSVVVISPVLLYRDGLAASLSSDGRLRVASTASPDRALAQVMLHRPAAVLLDADGNAGLELARALKAIEAGCVLVGFGISNSAAKAIACAEAGFAGFIDETGSIDALVETTLSALQGEFQCSPRLAALLCQRLASLASGVCVRTPVGLSPLTPREQEVASLVCEGLSNKEIAIDLRIGPATVKNHVHNILDKLGVRRRAGIAARVQGREQVEV